MRGATFIGRDLTSDAPVQLSLKSRMDGLYVLGKQGRGKTNFLETLIFQDLHAGRGVGVLDAHGDLTVDVLAAIPPRREEDVLLLDLQDAAHPFAFDLFAGVNPADPSSLALGEERIVAIFKKVWGDTSWGARLEDLLGNAAHTLLVNPGATLADLPTLLADAAYRARLVRNVGNAAVREFWREYDGYSPKFQATIYAPLTNKVRAFLRHALLARIVSQPGATIDFAEVMARRQILLVRLDPQLHEATSLLGGTILLRLLEAALGRKRLPARSRPPFMLYADEFQLFASSTFGRLLQEARKYAVATTLAHQLRAQLPSELRDAVKGAVNIVSFQLMTDDAGEMSRDYAVRSRRGRAPADLFDWAVNHSDPIIRAAAALVLGSLPAVAIRYVDEEPELSTRAKLAFIERRLRQAVREGNAKATPFPSQYWYGTHDLQSEPYARLADGFAILRDRLLATQRIDAAELAALPRGVAAAKLEQEDGSLRQCLLRFPLAISPDHAVVVKRLLDHEGALPQAWPEELNPAFVQAGLRARRIRLRSRERYDAGTPASAAPKAEPRPAPTSPPAAAERRAPPVTAEVDLDP